MDGPVEPFTTKLGQTKANGAGKLYEGYSPSLQAKGSAPALLGAPEVSGTVRSHARPGSNTSTEVVTGPSAYHAYHGYEQPDDGVQTLLGGASKGRLSLHDGPLIMGESEGTPAVPFDPKPDGPRYAAMGDAVTVDVIEWIGTRLIARM